MRVRGMLVRGEGHALQVQHGRAQPAAARCCCGGSASDRWSAWGGVRGALPCWVAGVAKPRVASTGVDRSELLF